MRAAAVIDRADTLCPNSYDMLFKLSQLTIAEDWLRQMVFNCFEPDSPAAQPTALPAPVSASEANSSPEGNGSPARGLLRADSELIADTAEGESYYLNFLIAFICLFNGENQRYNQHMSLSTAAFRRLTEEKLSRQCPKSRGGFRY